MKVKELISIINDNEEPFYSLSEVQFYLNKKSVQTINIDTNRDYSFATDIYKCTDGFVGITGLYHVFSKCFSFSDFCFKCIASEYEEVKVVTYKPKECHS